MRSDRPVAPSSSPAAAADANAEVDVNAHAHAHAHADALRGVRKVLMWDRRQLGNELLFTLLNPVLRTHSQRVHSTHTQHTHSTHTALTQQHAGLGWCSPSSLALSRKYGELCSFHDGSSPSHCSECTQISSKDAKSHRKERHYFAGQRAAAASRALACL